ncbi:transposase [Salipaludibacillus sp. LMS25]|uniref:IS91 family transposase n=1 Tax=Salipaludibacillus sp. LMS25 TaxID=2924031 RepID=UPI0020D15632|nr:transposase [Salipaludibacillus sp. LMS25]UTR14298.1 transposase [Salipaludibacillus sp. LMS25]UTR16876.1 transposase [Salipaludibacillus sp. LMS25]
MGKNGGVIKKILWDHFAGFWEIQDHRFPKDYQNDIYETVDKAMKCGSRDLGFAKYECLGCQGETKPVFIGFTCKSRFCHKCGKKYTDEWSDKQEEMIFDVPHRHMVFTIPEELRKVFFRDRYKLNELSKEVAEVFKNYFYHKSKKRRMEVGVITVIHTFGRDLKFNPHIHALVTEGALDRHKEWVPSEYISYHYLRKSWQKLVLDLMKRWFPQNDRTDELINDLYQRYPHGFYVNAETKMKHAKGAAKYIGRYLARPAIAEYRITSYNGQTVKFWYEDHRTGQRKDVAWPVYKFIFKLLQHIPPKHFRIVGRFGLYSRRSHKQANAILKLYTFVRVRKISLLLETSKKKKTYRQRMIEEFERDPYQCPHCQREMELTMIWPADHGYLYHYMEGMTILKTEMKRRREMDAIKRRAG